MRFCQHCGKELHSDAAFCSSCGAKAAAPDAALVATDDSLAEEQEFLDMTHRLLRWERMSWSIAGKAYLIIGIVFAALFAILGIAFLAMEDVFGGVFGAIYLLYSLIFGSMFIVLGIVNRKAADKIPFYMNNIYTDFRYAHDRCGSVGMLVFNVILGTVSPIFFIINFVRMKVNRKLIRKILDRQQNF